MPPHLHPRSTATSTLFAGTLLASFTVVAIPHIFPCPRPRRAYADSDRQSQVQSVANGNLRQTPKAKRRRKDSAGAPGMVALEAEELPGTRKGKSADLDQDAELFTQFAEEAKVLERERHECPVPKPDKILARLLGFQEDETGDERSGRGKVKFRGDSRPDVA